jgi:hypothetical protein
MRHNEPNLEVSVADEGDEQTDEDRDRADNLENRARLTRGLGVKRWDWLG